MLMQDTHDMHFRERVRNRVFEVLWDAPAITFEQILKTITEDENEKIKCMTIVRRIMRLKQKYLDI